MRALHLLLLGTAVLASACGGGGGNGIVGNSSGSSSSSSGGSSSSSSSSGGSSSSSSGVAVISGNYQGNISGPPRPNSQITIYLDHAGLGEAVQFINGTAVSITHLNSPVVPGSGTYTGTIYATNGNLLDGGGSVESINAQLAGNPGQNLSGTYSDSGGFSGNILTNYIAAPFTASLGSIAGNYSFSYSISGQSYSGNVTVAGSGAITGSDTAGCTYSGTVSGPPADNIFDLTFSTSCLSGALSGVLVADGTNNLLLAVNNASGGLYAAMFKQ